MKSQHLHGGLEMTAAMLISGTIGWFVLHSGVPVLQVVFWRCAIGLLALLVICWSLGLFAKARFTLPLLGLAVAGGVAIVLNWLLLFEAYPRASISVATVVYNTQPFMLTAIGMTVFGERPSLQKIGWLVVSFLGVVLIISSRPESAHGTSYVSSEYGMGIALALGAAALYAIAAAITKKLQGIPPHLTALVQVATGMVMLAPFASFSDLPQTGAAWGSLIALGVVHTGVMYALLYGAIQKLPTTLTAALSYIYPLAAIAVDRIGFGIELQPVQIAGAAAIILAAAGVSFGWRLLPLRTAGQCG